MRSLPVIEPPGLRKVYVRRSDVDATFAVAQAKLRALLDAAGK